MSVAGKATMNTEQLNDQTTNQTPPTPRPGERVQRWWCKGCEEWHEREPILAAVKTEAEKLEREKEQNRL